MVYIDIFPMDNVKPDTLMGKLQPKLFNLLYIISCSRIKKGRSMQNFFQIDVLDLFFTIF